ncbi:hypothetical protein V2J09_011511 [Rumex salicifolius]
MAADSSAGFHQEQYLGPAMNRNVISFQSGAVNSSSGMIGMGNYYSTNNVTGSSVFSGSSGMILTNSPTATQAGSSASLLFGSVNGLKHDTGLAVEWSADEQYKLEEGLIKYADVPSILKYVKIASTLREKTVRDVALRCRWMTRKRRKQEDPHLGRKGSNRKEKLLQPPSKTNLSVSSTPNMATHSFSMHQMDHNEQIKWEKQLGSFWIIIFNFLLQDNIDLFCRTRENINNLCAILKSTPGRVNHIQEFPVSINQELADSILPRSTQMMMINMSSIVPPKQDLRYSGAPPGVNV